MVNPSTGSALLADLSNLVVLAQDDDFIGSPLFFVIGGVIVAGLIGLLLYLRSRKDEDD